MSNPKNHPLWTQFVEWGNQQEFGVSFEHEEDWLDWWKCFLAGAKALSVKYDLDCLLPPTVLKD